MRGASCQARRPGARLRLDFVGYTCAPRSGRRPGTHGVGDEILRRRQTRKKPKTALPMPGARVPLSCDRCYIRRIWPEAGTTSAAARKQCNDAMPTGRGAKGARALNRWVARCRTRPARLLSIIDMITSHERALAAHRAPRWPCRNHDASANFRTTSRPEARADRRPIPQHRCFVLMPRLRPMTVPHPVPARPPNLSLEPCALNRSSNQCSTSEASFIPAASPLPPSSSGNVWNFDNKNDCERRQRRAPNA